MYSISRGGGKIIVSSFRCRWSNRLPSRQRISTCCAAAHSHLPNPLSGAPNPPPPRVSIGNTSKLRSGLLAFPDRFDRLRPKEAATVRKIDVNRLLVSKDVQNALKHRGGQMHPYDAVAFVIGFEQHSGIIESN